MYNQQTQRIREFYALYAQTLKTRGVSPDGWAKLMAIQELPHLDMEQQDMCQRLQYLMARGKIQLV